MTEAQRDEAMTHAAAYVRRVLLAGLRRIADREKAAQIERILNGKNHVKD